MVERLKEAIEKARQRREGVDESVRGQAPAPNLAPSAGAPHGLASARSGGFDIQRFAEIVPDPDTLRHERIVSLTKSDPAYVAFDVLRTRLLSVCRQNGWTRVGVTSPTKGCGKTTVCANLAFTLVRQAGARTLLLDLDLRRPHLAHLLHIADSPSAAAFLSGETAPEDYFRRIDASLVLGLNGKSVRDSAELLQRPETARRLAEATAMIAPDLVIYDLPPVLGGDDVIGFLPNVDCLIMVVAGGLTRPHELEAAERLITDATNFLGVVLNRCGDDPTATSYAYTY